MPSRVMEAQLLIPQGSLVSEVSYATPTSSHFELIHPQPQLPAPQNLVFGLISKKENSDRLGEKDSRFPPQGLTAPFEKE